MDELFGGERIEHFFRGIRDKEVLFLLFSIAAEMLGPAGFEDEGDGLPLLSRIQMRQELVHAFGLGVKHVTRQFRFVMTEVVELGECHIHKTGDDFPGHPDLCGVDY